MANPTSKRPFHLSASAIACFKSCVLRFYYSYILGIKRIEDTDSQRRGTLWHRCLEFLRLRPGSICTNCYPTPDGNCPVCQGTSTVPAEPLDAAIRLLDEGYSGIQTPEQAEKLGLERTRILYSLSGYRWLYSNDNFETVATEIPFEIPLINPETGRALPNVVVKGKIDKLVRLNNQVMIFEHKSTSKSVAPDSDYWGHLRLDTQTRLYPYAAQYLQRTGQLEKYGIKPTDPLIDTVWYDVWHLPTIEPSKLSQGDSKKFVESGEYCGQKFEVVCDPCGPDPVTDITPFMVNGTLPEIIPGAKPGTFAIRETLDMYGARLLQDITQRPEFYFARREIKRTPAEIQAFGVELVTIYRNILALKRSNGWYPNEQQCEAKYKCDYLNSCYSGESITAENVPAGFRCIFESKENADGE